MWALRMFAFCRPLGLTGGCKVGLWEKAPREGLQAGTYRRGRAEPRVRSGGSQHPTGRWINEPGVEEQGADWSWESGELR